MQSLINDATRIKNISSNYIRAQQAEREGDDRRELRLLLFTVQDISVLLKAWHTDRRDADNHCVMVYMKDNTQTHLPDGYKLRQEFPEVVV